MSKMIIGFLGLPKNVNKWCAVRIAVGIMVLFLVMVGGAGAVTPITDCTTISSPGTYALTRNIGNSANSIFCISITSSDVVFDGAGYMIDGTDAESTSYGIHVYNPSNALTNVNLKNLIVINWITGINYSNVQKGIISNNNVSSNKLGFSNGYGISLDSSRNNMLNDNIVSNNNRIGIYLQKSSDNTLVSNNVSLSLGSISLDFSNNNKLSNNKVLNDISLVNSSNNILSGNNVTSGSIILGGYSQSASSNGNTLSGNNVLKNNPKDGIWIGFSSNNILSGNNVQLNHNGIHLYYSNNNTLSENNASNNGFGILLDSSNNNTLSRNILSSNLNPGYMVGMYVTLGSSGNTIYDNFFNYPDNIRFTGTDVNKWNIAKTEGTNIVGGPYIGGNVWSYPSGTGYSNTCNDVDNDGICDSSRTLDASNIDNLPLVYIPVIPAPAVTPTITTIKITPTTTAIQRTVVTPTITTVKITPSITATQRTTVTISPKMPGFELVSMIVPVGIAILRIRRKK